jgi:hypothetical protein
MLEPEPKPKTKASAVTRRRGPPRVLLACENGKALYVNATCDAVRTVLTECECRHRFLETAFPAENAALKAKFADAVLQMHAEILSEIEDIVKIGGILTRTNPTTPRSMGAAVNPPIWARKNLEVSSFTAQEV